MRHIASYMAHTGSYTAQIGCYVVHTWSTKYEGTPGSICSKSSTGSTDSKAYDEHQQNDDASHVFITNVSNISQILNNIHLETTSETNLLLNHNFLPNILSLCVLKTIQNRFHENLDIA